MYSQRRIQILHRSRLTDTAMHHIIPVTGYTGGEVCERDKIVALKSAFDAAGRHASDSLNGGINIILYVPSYYGKSRL